MLDDALSDAEFMREMQAKVADKPRVIKCDSPIIPATRVDDLPDKPRRMMVAMLEIWSRRTFGEMDMGPGFPFEEFEHVATQLVDKGILKPVLDGEGWIMALWAGDGYVC